jgi:beta-phosphoglucomutase family hydrolase
MEASGMRTLQLPDPMRACLFDLDGVLTDTARVHAAAWKEMFDGFLREYQSPAGEPVRPFELERDYNDYLDGLPRYDGVRSFLASRGIDLPNETIHRLGDRKDEIFLGILRARGVEPYPGSVQFVDAAREAGLRTAVVSSSVHCREVLEAAGIARLFEAGIDGTVLERERLRGKPAPDAYLAAARRLGVGHEHAAVFEDALAEVEAGRAGRFGYVVGVDRSGHAQALRDHGADVVVEDLAELIKP